MITPVSYRSIAGYTITALNHPSHATISQSNSANSSLTDFQYLHMICQRTVLFLIVRIHDALDQINQAEYGDHYMIIYPDLLTLRELYSSYIHKQIEEN